MYLRQGEQGLNNPAPDRIRRRAERLDSHRDSSQGMVLGWQSCLPSCVVEYTSRIVWVYGVDKPDGMMVQCLRALLTVPLPGSTNLC